jgi:ceramide glucosyltransferase
MGTPSGLQVVLLIGVALTWVGTLTWWATTWFLLRRRRRPEPTRWPSVSILKPLAGLGDDELLENLESHVRLDYPGEYEVLLGVESDRDPVWGLAIGFAARYPGKVRVLVQEGAPGLNPKVNQLITLTRHARFELLAVTDSNVRVPPHYLREHVAYLEGREGVGLSSNCFYGDGEQTLGSALDNMTLASFVLAALATGDVLLRISQIVSKSLVIRREALEAVGGWAAFKDLLAEDQRLGRALNRAGYKTVICRTPVANVQRTKSFLHFWRRHTRWAMIRYRVVSPGVYLEPLLNPTVFALAYLASAWHQPAAWFLAAASMLLSMVYTSALVSLCRQPMPLRWLLLTPVRDVLLFAAWVAGRFIDTVDWRGHVLTVGPETRLTQPRPLPGPIIGREVER